MPAVSRRQSSMRAWTLVKAEKTFEDVGGRVCAGCSVYSCQAAVSSAVSGHPRKHAKRSPLTGPPRRICT